MTLSPQAVAILSAIDTLRAAGIKAELQSDHADGLTGHITTPTPQAVYDALSTLQQAGINATVPHHGGRAVCIQMGARPGIPGTGSLDAITQAM